MIRVTVVYQAGLLRAALEELLRCGGEFEVSSVAHWSQRPAVGLAVPDVYVVDAECLEPARAADRAAAGRSALVALVPAQRPGVLRRAHEAGALGFVDKDGSKSRLLTAVRRAAKGDRFVDEALAPEFLTAAEMPLTQRELSVLALAAKGEPIAEVAASLHLSQGTVRNYMASVIRKVGARNRVDAIRIAQGAGWT
ncbi:response regulator transcription factor [Streptomyces sp. NPDC048389]|uniref:helix-turn-helix transcriptional regulator n=1 Tax=Streptomyces sp. NPDC048389 TaxID=3154622 RepID=UPI0034560471